MRSTSSTDSRQVTHRIHATSALSGLDFGVEFFEFDAGVFELEVPVDAALFGVGFF